MEEVEEGETQQSTKRPLGKQKRESAVPSKAEAVMNEAVTILKATASQSSDPIDDEEIFDRNIACGSRKIKDGRSKEFAKVKLQEIIFQAQFGLLTSAQHQHDAPIQQQQLHTWVYTLKSPLLPNSSVYSHTQHHSPLASPNNVCTNSGNIWK